MDDFALALQLQEQFDWEFSESVSGVKDELFSESAVKAQEGKSEDQPFVLEKSEDKLSLIDSKWELLDPNPDVRAMFLEFNDEYFWGKLAGVEVRWSPRMTS